MKGNNTKKRSSRENVDINSHEKKDSYLNIHIKRFKFLLRLIRQNARESDKIGDIGISPFSCICASEIGFDNFYAIVPNKQFIDKSLSCHASLNYLFFDLASNSSSTNPETSVITETLDIVVLSEVLEHLLSEDRSILNNLKKLLKPNGLLIITVPNATSLWNRIRLLIGRNIHSSKAEILNGVFGGYGHIREYTMKEVKSLLDDCGFKIKLLGGFNGYGGNGVAGRVARAFLNLAPASLSFHIVGVASKDDQHDT